jgi:hypothetical protein
VDGLPPSASGVKPVGCKFCPTSSTCLDGASTFWLFLAASTRDNRWNVRDIQRASMAKKSHLFSDPRKPSKAKIMGRHTPIYKRGRASRSPNSRCKSLTDSHRPVMIRSIRCCKLVLKCQRCARIVSLFWGGGTQNTSWLPLLHRTHLLWLLLQRRCTHKHIRTCHCSAPFSCIVCKYSVSSAGGFRL